MLHRNSLKVNVGQNSWSRLTNLQVVAIAVNALEHHSTILLRIPDDARVAYQDPLEAV